MGYTSLHLPMKQPRNPGALLVVSAVATLSFVVATFAYAGSVPAVTGDASARALQNGQRALYVRDVEVRPGWGAAVPGYIVSGFWVWDGIVTDFYVVGPGGAQQLLEGRTPSTVYRHVASVQSTMYGDNTVVWPAPGESRLEYVWLVSGADADNQARRVFGEAAARADREREHGDVGNPIHLVDPNAAPWLPWLLAGAAGALLSTLAFGAYWFRASRMQPIPAPAEGTERMLLLLQRGERFLVDLRNLLRLVALLLAFILPVALFLVMGAVWSMSPTIDLGRYMPWAPLVLLGGAACAYLCAWLVWMRHYLNVRRELRRWRTQPPVPAILE